MELSGGFGKLVTIAQLGRVYSTRQGKLVSIAIISKIGNIYLCTARPATDTSNYSLTLIYLPRTSLTFKLSIKSFS
jgi:hypothetical protein